MKTNTIRFNIEASDKECAFFAIYAGLRMYFNKKSENELPNEMSIAAAEAYCLLKQLEEKHPKQYKEAESEFNRVYLLGAAINKINPPKS